MQQTEDLLGEAQRVGYVVSEIERVFSEQYGDAAATGDFAAMNEIWDAWVPEGHAPARTCVCAPMPADELKVEITVTTAVDA